MAKNKYSSLDVSDAPVIRPLGAITDDLEPLILEMTEQHEMQWHEVLGLVHAYLQVHCPTAQEFYTEDGSSPRYYYGPNVTLKSS